MAEPRREAPAASSEQLAQEAEVTPHDRAIAPRFWAAYGTPLFRALLNARREKRDR